jgi:hypothetical protein
MDMHPREQLKRWMERSKLNPTEAAGVIGIPLWQFYKIASGARLPGRDNAVKIEQITGIPVRAWSSSELDTPERGTGTHGRK